MLAGLANSTNLPPQGQASGRTPFVLRSAIVAALACGLGFGQTLEEPSVEAPSGTPTAGESMAAGEFWFGFARAAAGARSSSAGTSNAVAYGYFGAPGSSFFGFLQGDGLGLSSLPTGGLFRFAFGPPAASNPLTGAARWNGYMFGSETGPATASAPIASVAGDAEISIANFLDPQVAVNFRNIEEVGSGRAREDIGWTGIPLADGAFRSEGGAAAPNKWISGQFHGADHRNVGGLFRSSGIVGAFGAARESVDSVSEPPVAGEPATAPGTVDTPPAMLRGPAEGPLAADSLAANLATLLANGRPKGFGLLGLGLDFGGAPDLLNQSLGLSGIARPDGYGTDRISSSLRAVFPRQGVGFARTTSRLDAQGFGIDVEATTNGLAVLGTQATSVVGQTGISLELPPLLETLASYLDERFQPFLSEGGEATYMASFGRMTPGALPTGGSARWTGTMRGWNEVIVGQPARPIEGHAQIVIADLAAPRADVAFTNIKGLSTSPLNSRLAWSGVPVARGIFRSEGVASGRIEGVFGGPEMEEVQGFFERGALSGVFGASRVPAGGSPTVADGLAASLRVQSRFDHLSVDMTRLAAVLGFDISGLRAQFGTLLGNAGQNREPPELDLTQPTAQAFILDALRQNGVAGGFAAVRSSLATMGVSDLAAVPVTQLQAVSQGLGLGPDVSLSAAVESIPALATSPTGVREGGANAALETAVRDLLTAENGLAELIGSATEVEIRRLRGFVPTGAGNLNLDGFGGWLGEGFYAVAQLARPLGPPDSGSSSVVAMALGEAPGTNPAAGSGRWTGSMVGVDRTTGTGTRGNLVRGEAEIGISDFRNPTVSVMFSNIIDVTTNEPKDDIGWNAIPLAEGVFETDAADGSRIEGEFFGADHAEVGGLFEKQGLFGAFGATRSAP